jgi:hypothetical protein
MPISTNNHRLTLDTAQRLTRRYSNEPSSGTTRIRYITRQISLKATPMPVFPDDSTPL